MKKFEYIKIVEKFVETENLNELGGKSWEIVGMTESLDDDGDSWFTIVFKRELKDDNS